MVVSTTFELASLAIRSCSAVKALPQVLHLQVEFAFWFPVPELTR
jgi:hypothetical protein